MTDCRPSLEGTSFRFLHSRHMFSAKRLLRSSSVRRSMAFHVGGFLSGPLFALFLAKTTMRNSVGTAGCRLAKEHT